MADAQRDPFDQQVLLDQARRNAGCDDFGDLSFLEPLGELLAALSAAPLNAVGQLVLRTSIRRSLVQRLRAIRCFDDHPEIEDERIDRPLVVLGMMRSGTTLMQRLLACDSQFHCALGWEIAEPAPRDEADCSDPTRRIEAGVARCAQMRAFAPQLHAIHPTDALEADEEIVYLADAFLSHVPEASCHVPAYRRYIDEQDLLPAYRHLERMLKLLQWQKRQRGECAERWVLKTPAHLGYLDTLRQVFPDAQIVWMHRDPVATIASGASLNLTLWRMHADDVDPKRVGAQWIERMHWATDRALRARDADPALEANIVDVDYRTLVAEPVRAIERVFQAMGSRLGEEACVAMQAWLEADRARKAPAHRYSPETFGLTEEGIRERFLDYSMRFLAPVVP